MGIGAVIVFSLFYLVAVGPYWKITPDSTVYVLAGESIAGGEGYTIKNQPVDVVPPMTSLIFSLCILLFPGSHLALNGAVTALTLGSVLLAFIKYTYNYDTQRLALWLKDHSSPSDAYLAQHSNMVDIMTQRRDTTCL